MRQPIGVVYISVVDFIVAVNSIIVIILAFGTILWCIERFWVSPPTTTTHKK
jgi:hypothetical protein